MSIEPGTSIGSYRVVRLIAQGGMAEVYRAEQQLAGGITRPAAIKVIRPEYSESTDFREMFLDEARTACTLSHPNIVHIYEVGEHEGLLYMTMELVPGTSLSAVGRVLNERGERFSDEALLAVGISTCAALEAVHVLKTPGAHPVNLVHRDISPQNLLLSAAGTLKLIDFGIAKAATNRNLTSPGMTKGKLGYFSPEQAMGLPLDGRSDLFSLGVTLYKLASGRTPFDDPSNGGLRSQALLTGQWEPLSRACPGLPEGLYQVVSRALALKAPERFGSAKAMREALERVALEAGLPVGPGSLAGYVQQQDDEITISPQSPRRTERVPAPARDVSPTVRAAPVLTPAPRHASAPRAKRASRLAAAAGLLLVVGSVGLWQRRESTPRGRPESASRRPAPAAGAEASRRAGGPLREGLTRRVEPARVELPHPEALVDGAAGSAGAPLRGPGGRDAAAGTGDGNPPPSTDLGPRASRSGAGDSSSSRVLLPSPPGAGDPSSSRVLHPSLPGAGDPSVGTATPRPGGAAPSPRPSRTLARAEAPHLARVESPPTATRSPPSRARAAPRAQAPSANAPPAEAQSGMGTLRIGSTARSTGVRVRVGGRAREDLPYTLQRAPAGRYVVEFLGPGSRRTRCTALVLADQRTRVLFDGDTCKVDQN